MDNNKQMITAVVEYNYNAVEPDELNLRKGDILHSIKCSPGGWWEGTLGGRTGMFPDNFVRVISMADPLNDQPVQMREKPGRTKCRAVFSYTPNNEDELALGVGDIIEVLGEVEEGWWRGKKDNCVGVFPSNFVVPVTTSSSPISGSRQRTKSLDSKGSAHSASSSKEDLTADAPSLPPKPVREICRVLFPYEAQNEDELNLREGDIVTIITKEVLDKGWWRGELRGRTGVFPDNFVQIIPSDSLSPARDTSGNSKPSRISQISSTKSINKTATNSSSTTSIVSSTPSNTSLNSTSSIPSSAPSNQQQQLRKDSFNSKHTSTTNASPPVSNTANSSGTVASQRKSLEMKIEAETEKTKPTAGAPPLPGKKPSVPAKKSPIASLAGGIFAGLKQRVKEVEQRLSNDHTDGCASSKISISPNNNNNPSELPSEKNVRGLSLKTEESSEFDQVERSALLQDPRALRPKAPGRRPPSQVAAKEDLSPGIMNGNSSEHHGSTELLSETIVEEEMVKPKTREWEKHKAPWMEELKLNQAKKGGDKIIDKAQSVDIDKKEEGKKENLNPLEMSKSMTSISSRIKIETANTDLALKKEQSDLTKSMTSIAKAGEQNAKDDSPAKSSGLLRNRSISPVARPLGSTPLRPVTISSSETSKQEKSETKVSPVILRMNNINNIRPSSLGGDKLFDKASGDENSTTESKLLLDLADKITRLEAAFERETKRFETAIEKLSNQLEIETRERLAVQAELEKLSHCVTQV